MHNNITQYIFGRILTPYAQFYIGKIVVCLGTLIKKTRLIYLTISFQQSNLNCSTILFAVFYKTWI